MVEEVFIGHVARVGFGGGRQRGVPGQRRGGAEGLRATLARFAASDVEFGQQFLAFGLPVAQACAEQRTGDDDSPVTVLMADTDIDELRVQHDLAKTLLYRFHRRGRVTGPGQADRLHVLHGVTGGHHGLLQIADAGGGQRQARVGRQRRQLRRHLTGAPLQLAAVGIDRFDQL